MNPTHLPLKALGLICIAALAACATQGGPAMRPYSQAALADAVRVPAGNVVKLESVGVGELTYECRAKTDMAGQFEWVFAGPDAALNDRSGKRIGRYYGPPATWEAADGSKITGTQLAVCALVFSVVPDAEPELKTFRSLVADGRVDGVFLSDLRHHDERIPLLVELGLPAVTLGRPDEPSPFPAVTVDDTPGVIASVAHLATLATPASRTSRAAVRCCMAAAGARPSPPPSARPGCRRDRPSRPISPWLPDRTPPAPPDPGDSPDRDRLRQRPDGHRRPRHGARAGGAGSRRALDHGLRRHRLLSLPLPAADERQLRTCLRAPSTCPM